MKKLTIALCLISGFIFSQNSTTELLTGNSVISWYASLDHPNYIYQFGKDKSWRTGRRKGCSLTHGEWNFIPPNQLHFSLRGKNRIADSLMYIIKDISKDSLTLEFTTYYYTFENDSAERSFFPLIITESLTLYRK